MKISLDIMFRSHFYLTGAIMLVTSALFSIDHPLNWQYVVLVPYFLNKELVLTSGVTTVLVMQKSFFI